MLIVLGLLGLIGFIFLCAYYLLGVWSIPAIIIGNIVLFIIEKDKKSKQTKSPNNDITGEDIMATHCGKHVWNKNERFKL